MNDAHMFDKHELLTFSSFSELLFLVYRACDADGPGQVSSLTGSSQHTNHIWDLPLPSTFFQGSCAFVYSAMSFTDKLSSGVVIYVIQQLKPVTHS